MRCCWLAEFPAVSTKKCEKLGKEHFFKIIFKNVIFRLYVYIFEHSIHFRNFCFVKLILEMNFIQKIFLLQYFLTKFFFVHDCKHFLPIWLGNLCWSLQHWRKGEVHMNLMPPGTPKVYVFFLFCITWAASVRRQKSLPKSNIMLLTMKNVTQDVIFAR